MAHLKDLIVNGDAHLGNGATVNGNLQADSYNGRIMLSTTAKPTPSSSGTGIVTENYLAWAMSGGKAQTPATTITKNPTISVATTGVITASYSGSQSITPTVTAGWVSAGTAGTVSTSGSTTSQLTTRNSGSLTASSATVTAPAGYYAAAATKSVASGSAATPATTITTNPTVSVSTKGVITASYSGTKSVTPTVSAGYVSSGTAGTIRANGSTTSQLTTKNSGSLTVSGVTVTAPAGYYAANATKSISQTGTYTPTIPPDPSGATTYDMTATNTNRYVVLKSWDYLPQQVTASTTTMKLWAAWNQAYAGGDFYYITYTSPTNFRVRVIGYIGIDNRTSGYLDFVANTIHNYVDDVYASIGMTTSSTASARPGVNNWVANTSRTGSNYLNPGQTVHIPTNASGGKIIIWVMGYYI